MDFKLPLTRSNLDLLLNEHHIIRRQLDSKIQALKILNQELEHCRNERDRLKVVIQQFDCETETNGEKSDISKEFTSNVYFPDSWRCKGQYEEALMRRLCHFKETNRQLQNEVREFKAKLKEADGDVKALREIIAKLNSEADDKRVGKWSDNFPLCERKTIVKQLETLENKYSMLEKDLQSVLDEKEELIKERDTYKNKVDRLNLELNFALKGDEKKTIDVDSILMENRYLQERLKQTQEEKSLYLQTLSKYKNILEKRRNRSTLNLGASVCESVLITHKQVEHMLQNTNLNQLPVTSAVVADLRSLALALFESLNDKNIALSHQKKANKTLGLRLADLESKISSLKLSDQVANQLIAVEEGSFSPTSENFDDEVKLDNLCDESLICSPEEKSFVEPLVPKDNDNSNTIMEKASVYFYSTDISSVEDEKEEYLPPQLQKLVQAAINDIENKLATH